LAPARRAIYPLGAVMVDLDHYEAINDRHGHAVGDAVLAAGRERVAGS
jgi:diguanylate cyclase (GGDEF)-like protein